MHPCSAHLGIQLLPVAQIMVSTSTSVPVDSTTQLGPLKETTDAFSVVKTPALNKSRYSERVYRQSSAFQDSIAKRSQACLTLSSNGNLCHKKTKQNGMGNS